MSSSRVPPHNTEAEEALLGAMLMSRSTIETVHETVLPSDFYNVPNGIIYGAMISMFARAVPIDALTVISELKSNNLLQHAGDPAHIVSLQSNVPAMGSAARYAQIVIEQATLRRLIAAGKEIENLGYSASDVPTAVEQASVMLAEVGSSSIPTEPDDISVEEFVSRPRDTVVKWVLHGLMRRRHKLMLVAREGPGKSSLLRFCAVCGAYGINPFRHERIKPIRTLIADFEHPEDALFDSFVPILKQAQANANIDTQDVTDRLWWKPEGINLRNRADMIRFENVISSRRPDLVCVGPLYAMYDNDSKDFGWETAARHVQNGLKKLMVKYNFGLMIEDHAPNDRENGIRPYGSSFWRRWPDIGIGLEPIPLPGDPKHDYEDRFSVVHWRGKRAEVDWPDRVIRGSSVKSNWYFEGRWGDEDF